jgi:hypothetical protein
MWKFLAALCCLGLVVIVIVAVVGARFSGWRFRMLSRQKVPVACISCGGKGWIKEQERILRFERDSFVDGEVRTHPCAACGGTGVVHR